MPAATPAFGGVPSPASRGSRTHAFWAAPLARYSDTSHDVVIV